MTQNNIVAAVVLGLAIMGAAFFYGQKSTTISMAPAVKTISVSAEGKVDVVPDTLVINAGVQINNAETQELAYQQMNESTNQIKALLQGAGIEDKFVQTSNLYASPNYSWEDGKQTLDGYQASQSLTIRIEKKDTSIANTLLDNIAKIPHITINGVSYDLSDKEAVYAEARKDALAKARAKADEMAKAAGVTISGVESISETTGGGYYPAPYYARAEMTMGASDQKTDISVGQIDYTATVNVAYSIK